MKTLFEVLFPNLNKRVIEMNRIIQQSGITLKHGMGTTGEQTLTTFSKF